MEAPKWRISKNELVKRGLMMNIIQAKSDHMDLVRELFREYQAWLDADVCFQGFEDELANLPGAYAEPKGAIYLAFDKDQAVACSAIKPSEDKPNKNAELKRLYVQEAFRGHGIGRDIFKASMHGARVMGYEGVVLETLPEKMQAAQFLYRDYGFKPITNYCDNADKGVECFRYRFQDNANSNIDNHAK